MTGRRLLLPLVLAVLLAGTLTSCLAVPGDTAKVVKIDAADVDGWHFDYYRNLAYPCSIRGYQTFAIGTRIGSSASASRPLWVKMRGGGVGWFDENGVPQPTAGNKSEIDLTAMLHFDTAGLMASVKAAPEGFRVLLVSMCSHDVYGGTNTPDPHNPNTTPDGKPRPTTGLISTKAAIQYTRGAYPTTKYFLHGTSAGGAGSLHVAWALQQQGIPPAGLVSDSGVIDQGWEVDAVQQGVCPADPDKQRGAVAARIDADIVKPENQPDFLVARGDLTVPVMHVWNHADQNSCGSTPMQCHLRDGSTVTLGAADCRHENLRRAIAGLGAGSRSVNMPVCVTAPDGPACGVHVVTTRANGVNTDPATPRDYQAAILTWVRARLADS
jgi:hypothetical protein